MNKVIISGRLAQDPKVGMTKKGTKFVTFNLAVDRRKPDEADTADFFRVTAFGKRAEAIEKYFKKGKPIVVTGELWSGSYENQHGETVKTVTIMMENFEFAPFDKPDEMAQIESEDQESVDPWEDGDPQDWFHL